ncbi:hypothetical protein [Burkholderia metallica]|uniref:hypothetical protein n=1 Tax=Burkholderia metallica TaxID=488729 RepID=UPI003AAB830F
MWTDGFAVACLHCEAEGPMRRTGTEAIEAWNLRAPIHASDCAVHNEPAYPNGPCDCGAILPPQKQEGAC